MGCPDKTTTTCESMEFDTAICHTGYGKFHFEALGTTALCIIIVGFQNGLMGYVFPAAQCELNLSSADLGYLNVMFLIGAVISCFLWGVLADVIGRRKILAASHLINATITILCSLNPTVTSLMICRFCNGFLIGAPGSIVFSYIAEFQPPKYRSAVICSCGIFFTTSWLLLPVLAWLILPISINYVYEPIFAFTPWRLFFLVIALPELLVGFWFIRLPESPKYHVAKGEVKEALTIMKKMFAQNTGKNPEEFPVKHILDAPNIETCSSDKLDTENKMSKILKDVGKQVLSLFRPPLIFITFLTTTIMFGNMFGTFGLGLWLPELFIRFQQFQVLHPNETVSVKQLAMLPVVHNKTCSTSLDPAVIVSTVALGVSALITSAICGYLATKTAVKTIPCITMFVGGLSAAAIYFLTSSTQNLIVACFFQASMIVANMTIGGIVVELFPTSVCGMAICLVMCTGRLGAMTSNLVFGLLMDKHCEIPITVVAVNVLIGAGLCVIVPSKKKTVAQNEDIEISIISNSKSKLDNIDS